MLLGLSAIDLITNIAIASLLFLVVNKSAFQFVSIYHNTPGDYAKDPKHGISNLLVRVVLPVVYASILQIALLALQIYTAWQIPKLNLLLAISFYWILRLSLRRILNLEQGPFWTQIIEAALSIITAWYIQFFLMDEVQSKGISILDDSNVVFQLVLLVFLGLCQLAINGITRRHKSEESGKSALKNRDKLKIEKQLYSLKKNYSKYFDQEYREDLCLQAVFYTFALVELSNRPWLRRQLERLLFKTGLVKTTGLMQVPSPERAFSDDESVQIALPKIKHIWENYLLRTGCVLHTYNDPRSFFFTQSFYSYEFNFMAERLNLDISTLYGHYCGTMNIDTQLLFRSAITFIQNNTFSSYRVRRAVCVQIPLFEEMSKLFDSSVMCCYEDGFRPMGNIIKPGYATAVIQCHKPNSTRLVELIRSCIATGDLHLVRFLSAEYCEIAFQLPSEVIDETKSHLLQEDLGIILFSTIQETEHSLEAVG